MSSNIPPLPLTPQDGQNARSCLHEGGSFVPHTQLFLILGSEQSWRFQLQQRGCSLCTSVLSRALTGKWGVRKPAAGRAVALSSSSHPSPRIPGRIIADSKGSPNFFLDELKALFPILSSSTGCIPRTPTHTKKWTVGQISQEHKLGREFPPPSGFQMFPLTEWPWEVKWGRWGFPGFVDGEWDEWFTQGISDNK